MAYYIKQGQNSIFMKVKIDKDECLIPKITSNKKKTEKIVRKMKKMSINQVVLDQETKEKKELVESLNNYDIAIIDGKWLMQYLLQNIIEFLNEKQNLIEAEVAILANDLTIEVRKNIEIFANEYKKIRIVTNHIEKFKKIEQEIYEQSGIPIIITNNRRRALTKSKLIINFDFVQETINQYNICENAIIINMSEKVKINKKRFCGIIVTDYEVEFQKVEDNRETEFIDSVDIYIKQNQFSLKEILEEKIYSKFQNLQNNKTFEEIKKIIENSNIKITKLYGINGEVA